MLFSCTRSLTLPKPAPQARALLAITRRLPRSVAARARSAAKSCGIACRGGRLLANTAHAMRGARARARAPRVFGLRPVQPDWRRRGGGVLRKFLDESAEWPRMIP